MMKILGAIGGGTLLGWAGICAAEMILARTLVWPLALLASSLAAVGVAASRERIGAATALGAILLIAWYIPIHLGPDYVIEEPGHSALQRKYEHISQSIGSIAAQEGACDAPGFVTILRGAFGTMRIGTVAEPTTQSCLIYGYGPDGDDDGGRQMGEGLSPADAPFDRIPFPCLALVIFQGQCAPDGDLAIAELHQGYFE